MPDSAWQRLRARLRLWAHARRLRRSGLFDAVYYREHAPEARTSGLDPVVHYLLQGGFDGRDPGPLFGSTAYLAANRDVAAAGLNPLLHYVTDGWARGRPLRDGAHEPPAMHRAAATLLRGLLRRSRVLYPLGNAAAAVVPLQARTGATPTAWVLAQADGLPGTEARLRITSGGRSRFTTVPIRPRRATLLRLPDTPAHIELVRPGPVPPDRKRPVLRLREIGRIEAGLRCLFSLRRTPRRLLALGPRQLVAQLAAAHRPAAIDTYQRWVDLYARPSPAQLAALTARVARTHGPAGGPLISIVVPVYNPPADALRAMIASVRAQIYPHWELCLCDDTSTAAHVAPLLQWAAAVDARVKLHSRRDNGGISAASNDALALATGSWLALLDHDDELAPYALAVMADAIAAHPTAELLYSDEDKIGPDGERFDPYFKPDFNLELLEGQNVVSHLGVYRASAVHELGGFRSAFDGSQDYDLALRVVARGKPVIHVPHVLYHWRLYPGAGTFSSTQADRAGTAARAALREAAEARGERVEVVAGPGGYHRVLRAPPAEWPRVTAIVPTRNHAEVLGTCIAGLLDGTDYPALDIVVADNGSDEPETLAAFAAMRERGVTVHPCPGPFNFSAINNAAASVATGELLLLLNNDVSVLHADWLREMVQLTRHPRVGAVGAKLLYPDNTLQHGGVVLGLGGVAGHIHIGASREDPGYFQRLSLTQEVSAVTAACLLVPRRHFAAVGGLDARNLAVAFNDIDFCLRLREAGLRILWTPHAVLRHWESKSRGSDFAPGQLSRFKAEIAYMQQRWGAQLAADPFYNPNRSLELGREGPSFPPRTPRPWEAARG